MKNIFRLRIIRFEKTNELIGEAITLPPKFKGKILLDDIEQLIWARHKEYGYRDTISAIRYDAIQYFGRDFIDEL